MKEDARALQEASQRDASLEEAGVAKIEEERARQRSAVADDVDPQKEAARIRDKHTRHLVRARTRESSRRVGLSVSCMSSYCRNSLFSGASPFLA